MSNYRSNFDGYAFNQDNYTPTSGKYNPDAEERGLISKSNRNLLRELLFLLPLIFFLIVLFFASGLLIKNHHSSDSGRNEAHSALEYLAKNIKLAPIQDAKFVKAGANCPDGFTKEILGNYPGSHSGCVCKDGSVHTRSYCWFKSSSDCKYSKGTQGHQYKVWSAHSVCTKRFTGWKKIKAASECKAPMKVCQKDICVSGTDCPIASIKLPKGTGGVQFNATHKIEFTREVTKEPIASVTADISKFPCSASSLHRPDTPSKKFYPLEKVKSSGCGKYSDLKDISQTIDTHSQAKFYKENGVEKSISALPFHSTLTSHFDDATLVSVDKIQIKNSKECENIEAGKITELGKELKRMSGVFTIIGVLLVVFSAIGLALTLLFLVLRGKISFLNGRGGYIILLIILAICVILATVMYAMHIHQQNSGEFQGIKNHFSNLNKHGCLKNANFKRAAEDVSKNASTSHSNLDWIVQTLFWTSVAIVAILLICLIVRKVKKLSVLPDPRV